MEPISLNHSHYFTSMKSSGASSELAIDDTKNQTNLRPSSDQVTLSPASIELYQSELGSSRFASMAEQSASKERQVNSWLTLDELATGVRRPFADQEEARLSTLSLSQLMEEINSLPNIDEFGHLQKGFAGTEQGDRLSTAVANLTIQSQYDFEKASASLSNSMSKFKSYVEEELGMDSTKFSIKYIDGKVTAVGVGENPLDNSKLEKIQKLLDDPDSPMVAKRLVNDITKYNEAASDLINNRLIAYTKGGAQNRYLPQELSVGEIMDGMDYSKVDSSSHLQGKWFGIVAEANGRYDDAIKDGSHLNNSSLDPGILELTKQRNGAG